MRLGMLLVLLLSAGSAMGQQPASTPDTDTVAHRATERVEQHIEALHRRLGITPAQQPQWQAFITAMRDNADAVERGHATNQPGVPGNALSELRSMAGRARLHADNLTRLLPPFEALYNVMSPEQRTLADTTFQQFQRGADAPTRP